MAETLHQPATEKASAPSEKEALPSEFVPEIIVPGGEQIKISSKPIHKDRQIRFDSEFVRTSLLAIVEAASIDRLTE